jgi:predicted extracellular nuclease
VEGIVTAVNFTGDGYFLSEPVSGAWRGIYVWDTEHKPKTGNYLRISGEVTEYFGMTCISNLNSYRILDQQRSLPSPIIISTSQLTNPLEAEAYEGVYVRLVNVSVSSIKSKNGKFMANDGSGPVVCHWEILELKPVYPLWVRSFYTFLVLLLFLMESIPSIL